MPPTALPVCPSSFTGLFQRPARPVSWPVGLQFLPNLDDWREGDILVMEQVPNAIASYAVVGIQQAHPDKQIQAYAHCTHCAVYVGNGLIADARLGTVAGVRRLSNEAGRRRISVLRFDARSVTADEVRRFVEVIFEFEGVPYVRGPAGLIQWLRGYNGSISGLPRSVVCSSLVEWAAAEAGVNLRQTMRHMNMGPSLPAMFMTLPLLTHVPAQWHIA
jgi:uncharacterized protein YycO